MRFSATRRWMALAATGAFMVTLAACTPGSDNSNSGNETTAASDVKTDAASLGDVTLTVWDQEVRGGQNEQMTKLNEEFHKKYPNITIKRNSQSFDDLQTTLSQALTDKKAPDVVQANNGRDQMGAFVTAKQLVNLDPYAKAYGWDKRFSSSVLQRMEYSSDGKTFGSGNLYGLPQVGEVVGIFYNKSLLKKAGVDLPETWDDFNKALATLKGKGITPIQLGDKDQWPAIHVFGPLQGNYVDAENINKLGFGQSGASWTASENVDAAKQLQDWVKAGYLNDGILGTTDTDMAKAFAQGKSAFMIAGSWNGADLDASMKDNVGFYAPAKAAGEAPATTGGTGLPFAITEASKNKDAAAAYIDFITNEDAMKVLADTGNLPVNDTAKLAPTTGVQSDIAKVFDTVSTKGSLLPYLDYATPTFSDTLGQSLQDLIASKSTPTQFTEKLQKDYGDFVKSNS